VNKRTKGGKLHWTVGKQWCCRDRCLTGPTSFNPLTPLLLYSTAVKHSVPDRVKLVICNFWDPGTLTSGLSVRVPGCQKLQMTAGLTRSSTGCFIAVPHMATLGHKGLTTNVHWLFDDSVPCGVWIQCHTSVCSWPKYVQWFHECSRWTNCKAYFSCKKASNSALGIYSSLRALLRLMEMRGARNGIYRDANARGGV